MAHQDGKDRFLSLLVEETYKVLPGSPDSAKNPNELKDYFDDQFKVNGNREKVKTLKKLCLDNGDSFYNLAFSSETNLFRLNVMSSSLDIPSNWSFFKDLISEHNEENYIVIDNSIDADNFLKVVAPFDFENGALIAVRFRNQFCLLILKDKNNCHSYLETFESELVQEAA